MSAIHGILVLDKPLGFSSNQILMRCKNLLGADKAGHTGTLDPLASGMLVLCFGYATRFTQYLLSADKRYRAVFKLGQCTDTADSEGLVTEQKDYSAVTVSQIAALLPHFCGTISQTPPRYSALKYRGKRLYQYARNGLPTPLKTRKVQIYSLQAESYTPPFLSLHIHCGRGTYIRSLAEDLGAQLGCGAHVVELRRIATANLTATDMVTLETLQAENMLQSQSATKWVRSIDDILTHLPILDLSTEQKKQLMHGQRLVSDHQANGFYRIYGKKGVRSIATPSEYSSLRFLGIVQVQDDIRAHTLIPEQYQ